MNTLERDFALTFAHQSGADILHKRQDHTVEEVVTLNVEVGGVGCYAEALKLILQREIALLRLGVVAL